jgi:hypothetical protein
MGDPGIDDSDRTGDDLIARIQELHRNKEGIGWRPLLYACERELIDQRRDLIDQRRELIDQRRTIKRLARDLEYCRQRAMLRCENCAGTGWLLDRGSPDELSGARADLAAAITRAEKAEAKLARVETERDTAYVEADLLRIWGTNLIRVERGELRGDSGEARQAKQGLAAELQAIKAAGLDAAGEKGGA